MSRDINQDFSYNNVNIVGKLIDATFGEGNTDGRYWERASLIIRVTQDVEGISETSEIPVSVFAFKYTKQQKLNPAFDNLQQLKQLKTAKNVGIDNADVVRIKGANIRENYFVSRNSGQLINGWQIMASFVNKGSGSEIASFTTEIYILDMHDEVDREGEPTGHLIIKGGIVQWGGKLDVLEFVVQAPDKVDYLQRNWQPETTVKAVGRIRITTVEDKKPASTSSWGEEIPEETTRTVRQLVITGGSDEPYEDDLSYERNDIRKAFNVRKALIEQAQIDAKAGQKSAAVPATEKAQKKYDWE